MDLHSADAEAAAADVQEAAVGAFAFEFLGAVAQGGQCAVGRIAPDFAEGAVFHVAECERLPELIGVDVALGINVADAATTAVGSATVPFEEIQHFLGAVRVLSEHAEVQVGTIGGLIDGEDFAGFASVVPLLGAVDDLIDGLTRLFVGDVYDVTATAAINEVIEADALDVFLLDEVEDAIEIDDVVGGKGEAQADFLTNGFAVAKGGDGFFKSALASAKLIVGGSDAVQGDADVGEVQAFQARGSGVINQRAVGG